MGNFNRGYGSDRDRGPRQMFKAVCDECGRECELPFKPTSSKPVYCSSCFDKVGGGRDRGNDRRNDRGRDRGFGDRRNDRRDREMFKAVCDECGKECNLPFKPSSNKPVYCDDCFGKNKNKNQNDLSDQIIMINEKLDKLMTFLDSKPKVEKKEEVKKEIKKTVLKKKVVEKKPVKEKFAQGESVLDGEETKKEVKKVVAKKTAAKKPAKKTAVKKKK